MLNFISFGSGSSGNCYFLYTGTEGLMIDIGIGIRTLRKHMHEFGLSLKDIHYLLITHDHADHIKSVGSLSKEGNIPVFTTHAVHEGIVKNRYVKSKIPLSAVKNIEKCETRRLGAFKVTAFGVPHDSTDNVGYRIECEDVVLCLMTDVGHVTDEMKGMISEADYLIIEANHDEEMLQNGPYPHYLKQRIMSENGHLSNHNCGIAVAENATPRLKHVWLCHLSEENNHPILARKTVEDILLSYGVVVDKDFELDVLKRTMPTGPFRLL